MKIKFQKFRLITFFQILNSSVSFFSPKPLILGILLLFFGVNDVMGQVTEGFESGLPSSYPTGTVNVTLGSGTWSITNVIAGSTGVNSGSKSAQLRSVTGSQITTPTISGGVGTISFYVTASTTSGAYQVNISSDNGSTWSAAPGSPFTISTTKTLRTITVNNYNVNKIQIYRTDATIYVDDFSTTTNPINGTIASNEYGTHTDGNNQQSSSTGTWYMTSDASNLYVGISGANTTQGAILYLDKSPIVPVNGGTNSDGTLVGNNYDGSSFANLPFRADLVVYFKDGYQEYRTSNGSNGWSNATTSGMTYNSSGGNVREIAIPWSVIGGRPTAYNWFGYVAYSGGGAYASVPTENPGSGGGLIIGTSATWDRYYTVSTTSTMPFSRKSYTFTSASDVSSFGSISAYDFTMNSSGRYISRTGNVSGNWTISGDLIVGAGTIYLGSGGSGYGTTSISGNLNILGGTFNMDQTTGALSVSGNVSVSSGATLTLSGTVGGDLSVSGNWSNNGTFNCSNRQVVFAGSTAQTLSGTNTFDYLKINNSAGVTLQASTPITINSNLDLTSGKLTLGANNLTLLQAATATNASSTSYIVTNSSGALVKNSVGNSATSFPVGLTSSYTPLSITNTGTSNTLSLIVSSPPSNAVTDATKIVNLEWNVNAASSGAVTSIDFNWNASNQGAAYSTSGTGELGNYTSGPNYAITSIGTMAAQSKSVTGIALSSGNNKLVLGNTNSIYAVPTIATTGTLVAVNTTYGTASANTSFSVSGSNLSSNISINPPAGYQISTSSTFASNVGTNGSPITLTPTSGSVSATTIYVRISETTGVGTYSGNIVLTSTGATTVNVPTVSSTVSAAAPTLGTFSNITKNFGDSNFTLTAPTSNSSGAFTYHQQLLPRKRQMGIIVQQALQPH
ncbi:MAG: hypothetical protein EBR38_09290 [Flavobacteriaceae bacterium]|nr:hypothetical protein [Flavobacteriaceae bacterium]